MTCYHCGATVTNGLALCDICQRFVVEVLTHLPTYFRHLSRWRPGGTNVRQVPGSRVLYDGERSSGGDRIAAVLDDAANTLDTWVKALTDDRPYLRRLSDRLAQSRRGNMSEAEAVAWICAGLTKWLHSIATLEWCGEFVRDLDRLDKRLLALTEDAMPGWYAGACQHCGIPSHVVPGLTWVTCRARICVGQDDTGRRLFEDIGCGAVTHASDHLPVILNEARGWVAPPMRLAEAAVALIGSEESVPRLHKRISKWGERGRLEAVDSLGYRREHDYAGEKYAPRRYRFGDVLDALAAEGATRPERAATARPKRVLQSVAVGGGVSVPGEPG